MGAEVSFPTIGGVRYCEVTGDGTVRGLGTFDLTAAGEIAPSLAAILVFADKFGRHGWYWSPAQWPRDPIVWRHSSTQYSSCWGSG